MALQQTHRALNLVSKLLVQTVKRTNFFKPPQIYYYCYQYYQSCCSYYQHYISQMQKQIADTLFPNFVTLEYKSLHDPSHAQLDS